MVIQRCARSWFVGNRMAEDGFLFMMDLKHRLSDSHVQLTTDGLRAYSAAIGLSFGAEVDRAPAMAARVADHVWTLQEIAALLD